MSELRVVATGLCFPEGPVAMRDGSVVLVEIERQTVSRVLPDGTVKVIAAPAAGRTALAIGPDGAFYVCNNGGFAWRLGGEPVPPGHGVVRLRQRPRSSVSIRRPARSRVLYDDCGANKLNGPNDIVFDTHGGFYFTDLGKTRARDRDHGGDLLRAGGRLEDRRGRASRS